MEIIRKGKVVRLDANQDSTEGDELIHSVGRYRVVRRKRKPFGAKKSSIAYVVLYEDLRTQVGSTKRFFNQKNDAIKAANDLASEENGYEKITAADIKKALKQNKVRHSVRKGARHITITKTGAIMFNKVDKHWCFDTKPEFLGGIDGAIYCADDLHLVAQLFKALQSRND